MDRTPLLKSKLFWIGILYFAEGFPLGVFYEIFPVYFRNQGVELKEIGLLSLLGLAWTLKFLWAPAIDFFRHHRWWMFSVDILMGAVMLFFSVVAGFGPWVWVAIGVFTVLSATNDIAIDGYTIELLEKQELGLANGIRIGLYRVGMLASGVILILSDYLSWSGAYVVAGITFGVLALACLAAPQERLKARQVSTGLAEEFKSILAHPYALAAILFFALGTLWLINRVTKWSAAFPYFWWAAFAVALGLWLMVTLLRGKPPEKEVGLPPALNQGPMFGALMEMLSRPYILPVVLFILIFKLADSSMGFMVKPFWVDAGFSNAQIGLVSVNLGLVLSIAGGIAGGWYTDRVGIFKALWVLGLAQALSNLGYAYAAHVLPIIPKGSEYVVPIAHQALIYSASALESFTGGLGTAAFLAFLMAIVDKRRSATEYALLSSIFALSRSFAGWAGGYGAQTMGYAPYFFLTFFLAFPAYFLLPWVARMLKYADTNLNIEESTPTAEKRNQ